MIHRGYRASACALFVAILLGNFAASVLAAPVNGEIRSLRQPDGTRLEVRVWGDEFYTVVETLDGYTLMRDPATGVVCYARLAPDGQTLLSTGIPAGARTPDNLGLVPHVRISQKAAARQAQAARAAFERRQWEGPLAPPRQRATRGPTTGAVRGICLIVDFSDDVATIPRNNVDNFCNLAGYTGYGNNGSVRDYYYDVSEGLLTYTNYVPPAYYRAAHPKSYYTDPSVEFGQRARELLYEALGDLEAQGFDFSQYDADHDGVVDALNCFYAGGADSAWAEGLWPHSSVMYFCADGVCTFMYQMSDMQNALHLSTFCHENGHMLMTWPDLYDYRYDSTGVGHFCLMAYGTSASNPCEPCAFMKCIAGWAQITILSTTQTGLSVRSTGNAVYKFPHPTVASEYYLIENRRQAGRDSGLPDAGLAIWHVDEFGCNDNHEQTPESHYLVTLVQADGQWHMEHNVNYGDSTDLFGAPTYTSCTPDTNPNTNWWIDGFSGLAITDIGPVGTTMTFSFTQLDCNGNFVRDSADIANGTSLDLNQNGIPDECESPTVCRGDCDCDGSVGFGDIDYFVAAIPDALEAWQALYATRHGGTPPTCPFANCDVNGSGHVGFDDIDPFVALVPSTCP